MGMEGPKPVGVVKPKFEFSTREEYDQWVAKIDDLGLSSDEVIPIMIANERVLMNSEGTWLEAGASVNAEGKLLEEVYPDLARWVKEN